MSKYRDKLFLEYKREGRLDICYSAWLIAKMEVLEEEVEQLKEVCIATVLRNQVEETKKELQDFGNAFKDPKDQAIDLAVNVAYDLTVALVFASSFEYAKGEPIKEVFQTVLRKHKIYDKFINKVTKEFENSNGNGS